MKDKTDGIRKFIRDLGSVTVAFSGGVDSSVLLAIVAEELPDDHLAVFVDIPFISERQRMSAKGMIDIIGARSEIVKLDWNDMNGAGMNGADRCYLCKRSIYESIDIVATCHGIEHKVDGENSSDKADDRPGRRSATEYGLISPFAILGIGRTEIEKMLSELLPGSGILKETCMATRIPSGTPFTSSDLRLIENGENIIRQISGVKQIRMRLKNYSAVLETRESEIHILTSKSAEISSELYKIGICNMTINQKPYKW